MQAEKEREEQLTAEIASLWNSSQTRATTIFIDKQKEEEIKTVMSSITLPPAAIPSWAQSLSDEELKSNLSELINSTKKSLQQE